MSGSPSAAMQSYGQALLDFHRGNLQSPLRVYRDDGDAEELPLALFFRGESELLSGEEIAIDRCRGRILDLGAGAGAISLLLQGRNLDVHAIDVSAEACEVMRARGVARVTCGDYATFDAEPFDTVLILGRTVGMVGSLSGLRTFLNELHRLLRPDGRVIFNSLDVRHTDVPRHLAYQESNERAGRYRGEFRIRFEYQNVRSPFVPWLHVDSVTCATIAAQAGWALEVLDEQPDGNYLAELRPLQD